MLKYITVVHHRTTRRLRKENRMKNSIKKCLSFVLSVLFVLTLLIPSVSAKEGQAISISIDGAKYNGTAFLKNSVTYVGIREFSSRMGAEYISWDSGTKTAFVKTDNLEITSKNTSNYIIANGRYLWAGTGIIIISGTMYVPVRTLAKAFNCEVIWNGKDYSVDIKKIKGSIVSGDGFYDDDEVYWLSRIISAEAGVEPFLGKVAVGTVVLNRVRSELYPDTIYDVIFDRKFGVQFTPAANGTVYNDPDRDSIIAAKLCLDGASIGENLLFFVNDSIAENTWVADNRAYVTTIGSHNFYA